MSELMQKNKPGDVCPVCGSGEIDANSPRTVYSCGTSSYDGRPNTVRQSEKCKLVAIFTYDEN